MARRIAGRRPARMTVPQRRKFVWARSAPGGLTAIGTTTAANLLAQFETAYGANLIGATVVRIRGLLIVEPPATAADHQLVIGVKVTEGAAGAQATISGPLEAPNDDWMLYEPFMTSATPTGYSQSLDPLRRVIDVKSSRKIEEMGQQLTIAADADVTSWELSWHLSVGLLLP